MTGKDAQNTKTSWSDTLTVYLQWPILQVFLLGIASGFPLLLTASTLSARLFDSGIDIKTIGILASIGIPYSLKFLIAPLIDATHIYGIKTHLGRRKAWTVFTQAGLTLLIFAMACIDPSENMFLLAMLALATACFSAVQDIVIDALRIEALTKADQGAGSAASIAGYRIGMLLAGAGAFAMAEFVSWKAAYLAAAAIMAACIPVTLSFKRLRGLEEQADVKEVKEAEERAISEALILDKDQANPEKTKAEYLYSDSDENKPQTQEQHKYKTFKEFLYTAVIAPFVDFFKRPGALAILLFIALFKLGDAMAGTLSGVFYLDLGFTKIEIAAIQKVIGVVAVLGGTFIGGFMVKRMPIYKALIICGILQILSNFVFVWLDYVGANLSALTVAIIVENVTGGMGSAAFVAYMSQLCNAKFTATQYALLSSLSSIGRTLFASTAGFLQTINGWSTFFVITAFLGVPGMCILYFVQKNAQKQAENALTETEAI